VWTALTRAIRQVLPELRALAGWGALLGLLGWGEDCRLSDCSRRSPNEFFSSL